MDGVREVLRFSVGVCMSSCLLSMLPADVVLKYVT